MYRSVSSFILFFFFLINIHAQIIYTSKDSIEVERLLKKSTALSRNNKVFFFAESFLGRPYKVATLETEREECLVINLREFDCTTFVETVSALYLASEGKEKNFQEFKNALQTLRYRDGLLNGYTSRLHYFSEWIYNNQEKGIISDITLSYPFKKKTLPLDYMSAHPESYLQLSNNPANQKRIKEVEQRLAQIDFTYIPKEYVHHLHNPGELKNGQIVAITTDIAGLDITHVGFAVRKDNKVHLLHASSLHKKVVIDPLPLDEYVNKGKRNEGIKVITLFPGIFTINELDI